MSAELLDNDFMKKGRLEAFSDGVLAIIITIMVLELKVPHGDQLSDLQPLMPVFLSYILSFIYVGIYWNNHHHMFHAVEHVDGKSLWANSHLLFWLSLIPATTAWMGENSFTAWPVALYGVNLLMCAIAYFILTKALLAAGKNQTLAHALGSDFKGRISVVIYIIGIPLAFLQWWLACVAYVAVAAMWLVPDKRIENRLAKSSH
jgi:uncharacterized membrane protein